MIYPGSEDWERNFVRLQQQTKEVSEAKHWQLGTRLSWALYPFRYARAGSFLKADYPAYAHFEAELRQDGEGRTIWGLEEAELMWNDLRPEGDECFLMGWPVVDVAPGHYFWLREKV